jgi:hypothetical protein
MDARLDYIIAVAVWFFCGRLIFRRLGRIQQGELKRLADQPVVV